jgi:hypothetical protein
MAALLITLVACLALIVIIVLAASPRPPRNLPPAR